MDPRIEKITKGLRDFFEQAGFKKAVVGLSGGVDSSLTAKFGVLALGKESVTALLMPNEGVSSDHSIVDAKEWAEELGIEHRVISINDFVERYKKLPWNESEHAHMNLQARVRGTILYHYANTHKALVLGTGNKTEKLLGYFTKYGDGAVDILPIGNLYKTDVWEIAKHLRLPEKIIKKTPSAELKEGQTDEGEIGMKYADIDAILKKFETSGEAREEAEKMLKRRIEIGEHKLHTAPVIKVDGDEFLIKPTLKYKDSWLTAIQEFNDEGARGFWNMPTYPTDIEEYIERTQNLSKGKNLPDGWMPATTYWLIDGETFVGHVNIRHKLNDHLKTIGGHIGFHIRPSQRQKGYGYRILELALQKARELGLKEVMITCDDDNIPSQKVIERSGGKLKEKIETKEHGLVRHYWIEFE